MMLSLNLTPSGLQVSDLEPLVTVFNAGYQRPDARWEQYHTQKYQALRVYAALRDSAVLARHCDMTWEPGPQERGVERV